MDKNKRLPIIAATLMVSFSLILFRTFTISQFEHSSRRNFMRGDAYSDVNLYSAVLHFKDSGLASTKALPVHYYKVPVADTGLHPVAYTHYPALPDVLAYGYSVVLGTVDESALRCVMVLISLLYAWLLWQVLRRIINDEKILLWSWVMLILSNYFIGWSDSLHKHVYEEFFKALFVLILLLYHEKPHWLKIAGMTLVMVVAANVSFEPLVYLAVVCVAYALYNKKGLFSVITIFPAIGAVVGVLLHFYQNVLYFGSFELALADITETAKLRTAGIEVSGIHKKLESPFGWQQFISLPVIWLTRIERFFPVPAFAVLIMWYFVRHELTLHMGKLWKRWSLILFLASFSWCVVMSQHAYVHSFTMRQAGVFYALFAGPVTCLFFMKLRTGFRSWSWQAKTCSIVLLFYVAAMMFSQQVWDLWLKHTLL